MTVEVKPGDLVTLKYTKPGSVWLIECNDQAAQVVDYGTGEDKYTVAGTINPNEIVAVVGQWTLNEIIAARERFLGFPISDRMKAAFLRTFANLVKQ